MNRRILIQVATPTVLLGLMLCAACLGSAWYVNRLQGRLADILAENVTSMEAAQQLEVSARQLRFHCFLYLIDPDEALLRDVKEEEGHFEAWLARAEGLATTPVEQEQMLAVRAGYDHYCREFWRAQALAMQDRPKLSYRSLAQAHPVRRVTDACREHQRTNEQMMNDSAEQSARFTRRLHFTLLLLALGAPLGGLISGYGIARGLSRSLYRLSVRVNDVAQQLDRHVATVDLKPDGDLAQLERQLQHVVARVSDVTRRVQRQQYEMLRANQLAAVGQLAASVAHEVRNPLTSVKMLVEAALRQHKPRPFTPDNLRVVHGEVLRVEQTVQHFLDFARPPALERQRCDLRPVVAQAAELIRARARQQRVDVELHGPEQPVEGEVDRGQLCMVLVNLFVNALDAMPQGGRLTARLTASPAGVRLTVSDTGEGVSPKMGGRLFTPFASTKPTGCGLGLSISRRIIEEHGGTLTFSDGHPAGACFTIALPAAERAAAGPHHTEQGHAGTAGH